MDSINIKRIIKDITYLQNNNLKSHGIYHYFTDDNIYNIKILMIGPKDTPYHNGFYFFSINIPEKYPFVPPIVKYYTQGNNVRFNPNLYINGKVCLSIINTWSGPAWTSCNSISTVLLSIQSLVFIDKPLHNEPGFENENSSRVDDYTDIINHENYNIAIIKMFNNIPNDFEYFIPIMQTHIKDNYSLLIEELDKLKEYDNITKKCKFYNMEVKFNYKQIKKKIINIYNDIMNIK